MANERISMRKMRDIIRLREKGLGYRQIGRALRISHPVVSQYARDFAATGLSYEQIKGISDSDLMELLAGGRTADARYGELGAWFERPTRNPLVLRPLRRSAEVPSSALATTWPCRPPDFLSRPPTAPHRELLAAPPLP